MKKLSHITILDQYAVNMDIILGKGSTGCVYEGLNMKTSQKVAVKVVDLRTIDNQVAQYLLNMQKIALMNVKSPYVLRGLKVAQDTNYCFMVTEYCNGGTLKKYIRSQPNNCLNQEKALKLVHYLLLGYKTLVQKRITHRDLKPANIMLHNQTPKIIDFGYCEIQGYRKPSLQYNVGSPSYMAPESFQSNIYNQKTQIWSLGIILFQCLTGRTIDEGRHMSQVYLQIEIKGICFPSNISHFSKNIINWCLKKNPKNRPTCDQLLEAFLINKNRSITKISPFKNQQQSLSKYKKYNVLKNSTNLIKSIRQIQLNKKYLFKPNDTLTKSTKFEIKKPYKFPQFLQANNRQKSNYFDKKLISCHSTRDQIVSSKLYKNKRYDEYNQNKQNIQRNKKTYTHHTEYGDYDFNKYYHKTQNKKKIINIEDIYQKVCKNSHNFDKNRAISAQISISPSKKTQKKFRNNNFSNLPEKYNLSRNKRTYTQRGNLVRA